MDKNNTEVFKNLLHIPYRIEKSLIFGFIAGLSSILTITTKEEWWIGVFLIISSIHYFIGSYRFPLGKHQRYNKSRFDCSISDFLVAGSSAGLELVDCFNDMYILQTRYSLFQNNKIIVKDCKKYCEVIAKDNIKKCLDEYCFSKKV